MVREGNLGFPLIIKTNGLAAGKGMVIAQNLQEAELTIQKIMQEKILGSAGKAIILKKFLQGKEVSFLIFTNGSHALAMVPSQDHKTIFDDDLRPNTNNMGAFSADWILTPEMHQHILKTIVVPT